MQAGEKGEKKEKEEKGCEWITASRKREKKKLSSPRAKGKKKEKLLFTKQLHTHIMTNLLHKNSLHKLHSEGRLANTTRTQNNNFVLGHNSLSTSQTI